MQPIDGTSASETRQGDPAGQADPRRWTQPPRHRSVVPGGRPPTLPQGHAGTSLLPMSGLPRAGPPAGARAAFQPVLLVVDSRAVLVSDSNPALMRSLDDVWHNVVFEAVNRGALLHAPRARAQRWGPGQCVMTFSVATTLPGRRTPELVTVSLHVNDAANPARLEAVSLSSFAGGSLHAPFTSLLFGAGGGAPFCVRVPHSLPARALLDAYMPQAPSRFTVFDHPVLAHCSSVVFTSEVGLNQDICLEITADLCGVQRAFGALLVVPAVVFAPRPPGFAPPAPARFKVAQDVDRDAASRLTPPGSVGARMAAQGFDVALAAMTRFAFETYAQRGLLPQYEHLPDGSSACDVWSFTHQVGADAVTLKLRTIDLGQGQAEVVDAQLVRSGDAPVPWGQPLQPNSSLG